jgi:N-acetylglucosamine-6-phosphate deacetylase
MSSTNGDSDGMVCFTNCYLATDTGQLLKRDLWIDEDSGLIVSSQVSHLTFFTEVEIDRPQRVFYEDRRRPKRVVDLGGHILRL